MSTEMDDFKPGTVFTNDNGKTFLKRKVRNGDPYDADIGPSIGTVVLKQALNKNKLMQFLPHQIVLFKGDLILVNVSEKSIGDLYSFGGDTLYRVCPLEEVVTPIVLGGPEALMLVGKSATLFHNCEWLPMFVGANGMLTDEQPVVVEAPKAPKATKKTTKKSTTKRAKVRNNWSGRA